MTFEELTGSHHYNPEYDGYPPELAQCCSVNEDNVDLSMFYFGTAANATESDNEVHALNTKAWHRVIHTEIDPRHLQPYLAYRPLDIVKKTLQCTTQLARMVIRAPLRRHFKPRAPFANVSRLEEAVSTDPKFANCRSLHHGYTGAQVFYGINSHCINVYGFKSKSEFPRIYKDFIREEGAPSILRRDNAKEEASEEVLQINRDLFIKDGFSEPYHPYQNPVESQAICWLAQATHILLDRQGAPDTAWYFAMKYLAQVHNICYDTTLDMPPAQRRHGITKDISAYLQFQFWERVLYLDHEESWPSSKERPGYWVGVAENVGDILTYWIFDDQTKKLVARSVVRPFNKNKRVRWDPVFATTPLRETAQNGGDILPSKAKREKLLSNSMDKYDQDEPDPEEHFFDSQQEILEEDHPLVKHVLKDTYVDPGIDPSKPPTVPIKEQDSYKGTSLLRYSNKPQPMHPDIQLPKKEKKTPQKDVKYKEEYIPPDVKSEVITQGRTTKKKTSPKGDPSTKKETPPPQRRRSPRLHKVHANRMSTVWKPNRPIEFLLNGLILGTILYLSNTIISEPFQGLQKMDHTPLYPKSTKMKPIDSSQKLEDLRAYHSRLDQLGAMTDYQPDDERWRVAKIDRHLVRKEPFPKIFLKISYADGPKAWMSLDDLRMHDPMLCIKYAYQAKIENKPGWEWIPTYIKSDDNLVQMAHAFKTATKNGNKYKFGVEVPTSAKHAFELDKKNGNNNWEKATQLEVDQIKQYETFRVLQKGEKIPPGYKRIPYHIVYDVKFDGRHKARLVAGGHRSPEIPKEDIFSSVVSMEAVRLGFILAHMNGLLVCAGDVGNAFLYGKTKEKLYIIAGPEFGPELEGKIMFIDKSLYGLRSSAARFHEHLSTKVRKMGFRPSKADPDLWIRKHQDGHYEYLARFVDDVIAFAKDPMSIMKELEKTYTMKGVGKPQYYLGGDVIDTSEDWNKLGITTAFSAQTYIQNCLPKLASMCGIEQFHKSRTPFDSTYHAELDESPLCDSETISKYRSLIGSANWIITLGRFDIAYAVSTLSRYSMAPREGHFSAMQRVFGYLRSQPEGKILIDKSDPPIRNRATISTGYNWSEFYPDACEDIPDNMPPPQGMEGKITVYVDADHARDKVTRRSVTGILVLLNNTPIAWVSKRQKTVETSTYGSELVAARIAIDMIVEMRYKLRMLGVKLEDTSYLVGDNMAVILNTTLPSSSLKKKHQACNFHRIREAIAGRFVDFGHIDTKENMADIFTKPLGGPEFQNLTSKYLFRKAWCENQKN